MKKTRFIQKILSTLSIITFISLSGNMAAGVDLTYPGVTPDRNNDLIPTGSFSDNTVTVSVPSGKIRHVYGGSSNSEAVTNNTVTILGGNISRVYGGNSEWGAATGNTVTVSSRTIGGVIESVRGGFSLRGTATSNTVTISNGASMVEVYGGYSNGAATNNSVTVLEGAYAGNLACGGFSRNEAATNNSATISGGVISLHVYGGNSEWGATTGNTVTISGGAIGGYVYGGFSLRGTATNNSVTISNGEISGNVYGGLANTGEATGNTVTISDGEILGDIYGGFSRDGAATNNSVTISNGEISGNVYGGASNTGEATGNTVMISGGEILGDIYGGEMKGNVWGDGSFNAGAATGNTVTLESGASLSATSSIFGGFSGGDDADFFSGNKLVLNDFQGTIKQIANFEFINITSSGKEGDMLTLAGGEITDLSKTKVNITFTGISRPFHEGDKIKLLKNDTGIMMGSGTLQQEGQQQVQGTVYIYDLLFRSDENSIYATVEYKKFNDRSKALAEGRVASMAHLNMGADLIAGQGMAQALDSDQLTGKIHLFSAMAATNSQYDTGSHVDLYGYSALVGASIAPAVLPSLNCGVFAESGWGHYGSFSDFEDGAVRGSGSTQYYGGGLLTHYDFTKMGIKGLTVEASFRAGKTDTDYQSGDLANSKYDLSTPYYGVHAGVNYTRELSAKLKIANYARFFWSHLDGDNTTIEGSDFRFRTMDSQRIKAGSRLFYEIAPNITPYAGLSYEWECSGTARAVVDGVNGMEAPSLRGGTGTGELGAVWKPMAHQAFWVDFSVQGHVGERQGVSGVVRVRAEF